MLTCENCGTPIENPEYPDSAFCEACWQQYEADCDRETCIPINTLFPKFTGINPEKN